MAKVIAVTGATVTTVSEPEFRPDDPGSDEPARRQRRDAHGAGARGTRSGRAVPTVPTGAEGRTYDAIGYAILRGESGTTTPVRWEEP